MSNGSGKKYAPTQQHQKSRHPSKNFHAHSPTPSINSILFLNRKIVLLGHIVNGVD